MRKLDFWGTIAALAVMAGPAPAFEAAGDGGPRRLQVTGGAVEMRKVPQAEAEAVLGLAEGAVLSNMGCASGWCQVRPFRGGPRGFVDAAVLKPAPGPDGTVPIGPDDSRGRAKAGDFDAEGHALCAQEADDAMSPCPASVARQTGGDATVVVTFPSGFKRSLYFSNGEFISASATMSGVGRDMDWQRQGGAYLIRVDGQRFELAATFVFSE